MNIHQISITTILDLIEEFDQTIRIGQSSLTNEQKECFINQIERSLGKTSIYSWCVIHSLLLVSHIEILKIFPEFEKFNSFLCKKDIFVIIDQDVDLKRFQKLESLGFKSIEDQRFD